MLLLMRVCGKGEKECYIRTSPFYCWTDLRIKHYVLQKLGRKSWGAESLNLHVLDFNVIEYHKNIFVY